VAKAFDAACFGFSEPLWIAKLTAVKRSIPVNSVAALRAIGVSTAARASTSAWDLERSKLSWEAA
jgi:hypothetical protein